MNLSAATAPAPSGSITQLTSDSQATVAAAPPQISLPPSWKTIGGAAYGLAVHGDRLAALTPDRKAVWSWDPGTGQWSQIGGPAGALVGGG